ncbi:MAG: antibiotic biosynthesis monooxygenase family protein [Thermoplasmata archaeon]
MTRAARLWTIGIDPNEEEALLAGLHEISLPMLRDRPGFRGIFLLRTREGSHELSYLTLWRDVTALEEAVRSPEWEEALRRYEALKIQLTGPKIAHYDIIAWGMGRLGRAASNAKRAGPAP